jgi:hypothetical protein
MRTSSVLLAVGLLCLLGCGGKSGPAVVPVKGVVKIDGKPAAKILVQFNPVSWPENVPAQTATAVTDDAGNYVLDSGPNRSGATPGKHKVTFADNSLADEEEIPKAGSKRARSRVLPKYQSTALTPVEIEVVEGKSEYELNLSSR